MSITRFVKNYCRTSTHIPDEDLLDSLNVETTMFDFEIVLFEDTNFDRLYFYKNVNSRRMIAFYFYSDSHDNIIDIKEKLGGLDFDKWDCHTFSDINEALKYARKILINY